MKNTKETRNENVSSDNYVRVLDIDKYSKHFFLRILK